MAAGMALAQTADRSERLNFGDPQAVEEFIERRVRWLELQPAAPGDQRPLLQRVLRLLVEPEERIEASTQ